MNILGIIPARGGSKRVPQKNFRPFAGTTLTELAIQQALGSKWLTHIVLSSDSDAVLTIGRKYPKLTCLQRPAEISGDDAPAIEYVRHALAALEGTLGFANSQKSDNSFWDFAPSLLLARTPTTAGGAKYNAKSADLTFETPLGMQFDVVVILQPSSPLRIAGDIDATIQLLLDNPEADSAVSVVKLDHMVHPLKLKTLEGNALKPFLEDEAGRFAAQDLPEVYVRNCAVYATWRRDLETRPDVIGQKSLAYLMPRERSVDINDWVDFEFAEFLYKKHKKTA